MSCSNSLRKAKTYSGVQPTKSSAVWLQKAQIFPPQNRRVCSAHLRICKPIRPSFISAWGKITSRLISIALTWLGWKRWTNHSRQAYTYTFYGIVAQATGDIETAKDHLLIGLQLARPFAHPWLAEIALCFLGAAEHAEGCYEDAYAHFLEAIALCEVMKDPYITMLTGTLFSRTAQRQGQLAKTEELLQESLRIARESNNLWAIGLGLEQMAAIAQTTGKKAEARVLLEESAAKHREVGDIWSLSRALDALSQLELLQQDLEHAEVDAREAIQAAVKGQFYANALEALATLASIRILQGQELTALEFALIVLDHPASTWDARDRADKLRAELQPLLTEDQFASATVTRQNHQSGNPGARAVKDRNVLSPNPLLPHIFGYVEASGALNVFL